VEAGRLSLHGVALTWPIGCRGLAGCEGPPVVPKSTVRADQAAWAVMDREGRMPSALSGVQSVRKDMRGRTKAIPMDFGLPEKEH
jgi:hypothetical protein